MRDWPSGSGRHFGHCEERSDEAIQKPIRKIGLLRGACHRAGVRPTRWLAMTETRGRHRQYVTKIACVLDFLLYVDLQQRQGGRHVHAGAQFVRRRGKPPCRGRHACRAISGAHRRRRADRTQRLDACGLPQDADSADFPACAFRNRRHAARRQLDHPRAVLAPQGGAAGQGAGRMRSRAVSLCRGRDARRLARGTGRPDAVGEGQVFLDLQLSDADLGPTSA